jgi:peptidyl-prolyl cis-trans isomerase C
MMHFLLVSLFACQSPPPIPGSLERSGEVLTTVNGQNITQGMVDGILAQVPAETRDRIIAQGQTAKIKEDLITTELLYQQALTEKVHEKPDVQMAIAFAERQAMARALLEQVVASRTTDAAVKTYYDEHAVQYRRAQVKLRHILVTDQAKADELLAQLKGGADFATVAQASSMDARSAKEGGSMGWVDIKNLGPELTEPVTKAEPGTLVGPIQSRGGFHIILVEEKRDAVPLEEVKDQIKPKVREEIVTAYIEELKKAATIAAPGGSSGASVVPADDKKQEKKEEKAPEH